MKFMIKALMVAFVFAGSNLQAQISQLSGLEEFVLDAMSFEKTPGAAVSIVYGDKVVFSKGFGVREAGKPDPVDGDTLFAIGSNTKYFTATAVGLLVEDGKLDWDAPLTEYLPNLRFSDPYLYSEVTLRDALSHRSGLARADSAWYLSPGVSRGEVLDVVEYIPREIGLRSGFLYNNFMYVAAGEVISAVSEDGWDEVIAKRILSPLKMTRSSSGVSGLADKTNIATPHSVIDDKPLPRPYYNTDHVGPAGSIISSANDMVKWCKVQVADGKFGGKEIIPKRVIDEVRKPHTLLALAKDGLSGTKHSAYGLGILRSNYGDYVRYGHSGEIDGMRSNVTFVPEEKLCIVTLTNNDSSHLIGSVGNWVVDHMLGFSEEGKDYFSEFKELVENSKRQLSVINEAHVSSADSSVKPSVPLGDFSGIYSSKIYGDIVVRYDNSRLNVEYGKGFEGTLLHHRGNSFDLISDSKVRNVIKPNLTFSVGNDDQVDSVMVDFVSAKERFFLKRKF